MEFEVSDDIYILQAERRAKQNYLKEEIIDNGYDPNLFTAYMEEKRSTEIDQWTFEEIQDMIRDFKSRFRPETTLESILEERRKKEEKERKLYELPSKYTPKNYDSNPITHNSSSESVSDHAQQSASNHEEIEKNLTRKSINFFGDAVQDESREVENSSVLTASFPTSEYTQRAFATSSVPIRSDAHIEPSQSAASFATASGALSIVTTVDSRQKSVSEEFVLPDSYDLYYHNKKVDLYARAGVAMPETPLSSAENLEISITDHEVVQTGLLSSNYVAYFIVTKPLGWRVKRRFSDFIWFRDILGKMFPSYCLPPQPPKKATGRLQDSTILKRQRYLQKFMDALSRLPILLRCSIVVDFLREEQEKQFSKLKDKASKLSGPTKLQYYPSVDGQLICDPKPESDYLRKVREYLANSETLEKRLKRESEKLIEKLREASEAVHQYSETIKHLMSLQDSIPMNIGNKELYKSVSESLDTWSHFEIKKISYVNEYFNSFFKFKYTGVEAFKDLILARDAKYNNFVKSDNKLQEKKLKLWQQADPSRWGINDPRIDIAALRSSKDYALSKMIPQETSAVSVMKDEYAYYNFQVYAELERVLTDNSILDNRHFSQWARTMSSHSAEEKVFWESVQNTLKGYEEELLPHKTYLSRKE